MVPHLIDIFQTWTGDDNGALSIMYSHWQVTHKIVGFSGGRLWEKAITQWRSSDVTLMKYKIITAQLFYIQQTRMRISQYYVYPPESCSRFYYHGLT